MFDVGDDLGKLINHQVLEFERDEQLLWNEVFVLANKAKQGKPSKRYLSLSQDLIHQIGEKRFTERLKRWIEFTTSLKNISIPIPYNLGYEQHIYETKALLTKQNALLMKGMVWMIVLLQDNLLQTLADLVKRSYRKIPNIGPSSGALGNACLYVFGHAEGMKGLSFLLQLNNARLNKKTKSIILSYLKMASERLEIPLKNIEEMSIPDFGLHLGERHYEFDDYILEMKVLGIGKSKLTWFKPDGTIQKTTPSFINKNIEYSDAFKKIKTINSEIKKQLTHQKNKLDRSYVEQRVWNYGHFEKYFLNHGLMGFLTQRLIWNFKNKDQEITGIYCFGQWIDQHGNDINGLTTEMQVTLWHPVQDTVENVLIWRNLIMDWELLQPLKQAFREVYILTDAELKTNTYSNRMAAHIIKQTQFSALTRIRNWNYSIMGGFNHTDGIASISYPTYDLEGQFWVNELMTDEDSNYGVWSYVATDQVRFVKGKNQIVDLKDIPKLIFSETMRDIDLFVGVCSVGNDDEWADNAGQPQIREYWKAYSFGDLTEVAKTRKSVLEKLIPRLKIRDIAHIDGNFLVIKGKVRSYKIHIGSGNILMLPNDQYLCIVPDKKTETASKNLFLPFEGDKGLSIVLSKAFLLMDDDKIVDQTIVSQIG